MAQTDLFVNKILKQEARSRLRDEVSPELAALRDRIETWRSNKKYRAEPMPEELWRAAAALCDTHSVLLVRQVLNLDSGRFRAYQIACNGSAPPARQRRPPRAAPVDPRDGGEGGALVITPGQRLPLLETHPEEKLTVLINGGPERVEMNLDSSCISERSYDLVRFFITHALAPLQRRQDPVQEEDSTHDQRRRRRQ